MLSYNRMRGSSGSSLGRVCLVIIYIIARDVLTVPMSTVTSEAAFSAGGRVVSDKRCSLAPDSIEANICVKD